MVTGTENGGHLLTAPPKKRKYLPYGPASSNLSLVLAHTAESGSRGLDTDQGGEEMENGEEEWENKARAK